ncbi:MAG: hypothetical protein JNL74_22215, partial [Fibrobacteres bacterium]|nr:hypothetical protein [Fibrobacterota bacterium]
MTKENKIILTLLIVFIGAITTNASIKMITGFEKSEMESKITGVYSNNQITEITDSGFTYSAYVGGIPLYRWAIRNDIKTEGTNALRYKVEYIGYNSAYHTFNWTPYWTYYYPTAGNWGRQAMPIMYPHGWFENFPSLRDWSQHTKFWIDVYVKPAAVSLTSAKLQVAIEDEDITPPVMRQYNIPVNSWVTLEVNLKQAVAERKLKLSEIVNFWVLGFANSTVHLDNIRLAQDSDTTSLPTFKDSASMALPVLQPISTVNPVPQGKPNRTALSTITAPITIDSGMLVPSGFIGAFDNDHLFVTFNRFQGMAPANAALRMKQPLLTVQSSNGGASWGKMDSVRYPGPTPNVKWNFDHGSGRGNVVDMWGNSAWVSNTQGCTGFTPEPRQHVHLFDIADTSWSIRAVASMMDADVRHCGHSSSPIIRQRFGAKAGRLWASYGNHGRM